LKKGYICKRLEVEARMQLKTFCPLRAARNENRSASTAAFNGLFNFKKMANKLEDFTKEELIVMIKRLYIQGRLTKLNNDFPDNNDIMKINLMENFIYDAALDLDLNILDSAGYV
jgi:hypothetical protein